MMAHSSGYCGIVGLRTMVAAIVALCCAAGMAAEEPLHVRIDALVTDGNADLAAPQCDDGEFLRRVYLDLAGTIPSAAEARAFLDDSSPDKWAACIDRLLAGQRFARHMAQAFDVMLMERRPKKHVEIDPWQVYLYDSFVGDKPLDQLYRELLSADGVDAALRPSARFLLDREAEPNLLTRDVGRIVFGHDLQCAQCHDHPLIDDYHQRSYYEMFAFFNRTKLFTGKDKKVVLMEDAQGDVSYQSVFDSAAKGTVQPRIHGGKQIDDPKLAPDEVWAVAPAKDVRPVPKYSRRGQLPAQATKCRQFARNLANRLWAMLMGQGLVEPVDLHHSGNPPVHPRLLDLLADELVARKFSAKSLLREIALSKSYQRSSELPADLAPLAKTATARVPKLSQQRDQMAEVAATSADALTKVSEELMAAQEPMAPLIDELEKQKAALAAARKKAEEAAKALSAEQGKLKETQAIAQTVGEAVTKAEEAAKKLPKEKELAAAAKTFKTRSEKLTAELAALTDKAAKLQAAAETAKKKAAEAKNAVDEAAKKLEKAQARLIDVEPKYDAAVAQATYDDAQVKSIESRLAAANTLAEIASAGDDPSVAVKARDELIDRWSREWLVGSLRPLTPEQLAWSTMKAVGMVDAQLAAAAAETDRATPPSEAVLADAVARARKIEQAVFAKLHKNVDQFVKLFGAEAGQPQNEFFATVDQALFLANGPQVKSWLAPKGDNLTARLVKIDDSKVLAEELYLSIYTRRPTDPEVAAVTEYLKSRGAEKAEKKAEKTAAVQELAWGLLASIEFRFIH